MENYVKEFLEEYIADDTYNYAIMINGDWGSGKTFFVKDYISNHRNKESFLYVSLYGIKDMDEISKDIYAQILRKNSLYEKTLGKFRDRRIGVIGNIGSRIAVDLCKNNGIDVEGISKIYKNLVNLNKYIFVFDDLERSSIEMNQILGYINNLVEHNNIKAIIIANEPKIEKVDYREIKEKLVANTVVYEPEIEKVFKKLINNMDESKELKNSLIENINFLINKPNKNIRTYQFFLSKYRRAYNKLYKIYNKCIHEDLVKKVIEEMYESSINYKSGIRIDDDVRNLAFISQYIYLDIWNENEVVKISNLYLEKKEKEKSQCKLNKLEAWDILEDEEIIQLLEEIVVDIQKNQYSAEDFAKIIRLTLIIQDKGFDKKYLNDIISEMKVKNYQRKELEAVACLNDGYFSLKQEKNRKMSLEFNKIIGEVAESFEVNSNKEDAEVLNKILDSSDWIKIIKEWVENDKNLKNREHFSLCQVQKLENKIQKLNNNEIFELRILFNELIFYKKDKKFLEELKQEIDKLICKEKKNVKKVVLKYFSNDIEKAIGVLR